MNIEQEFKTGDWVHWDSPYIKDEVVSGKIEEIAESWMSIYIGHEGKCKVSFIASKINSNWAAEKSGEPIYKTYLN